MAKTAAEVDEEVGDAVSRTLRDYYVQEATGGNNLSVISGLIVSLTECLCFWVSLLEARKIRRTTGVLPDGPSQCPMTAALRCHILELAKSLLEDV